MDNMGKEISKKILESLLDNMKERKGKKIIAVISTKKPVESDEESKPVKKAKGKNLDELKKALFA